MFNISNCTNQPQSQLSCGNIINRMTYPCNNGCMYEPIQMRQNNQYVVSNNTYTNNNTPLYSNTPLYNNNNNNMSHSSCINIQQHCNYTDCNINTRTNTCTFNTFQEQCNVCQNMNNTYNNNTYNNLAMQLHKLNNNANINNVNIIQSNSPISSVNSCITSNYNNFNNNFNNNNNNGHIAAVTSNKVETKTIKKHVCTHCGKRFKYLSLLDRHITSHSDLKPFLCDYPTCNKRFQHKYYLNQHKRRTHNAIKRFKCSQCDKAFVEKCNLKIHMRKHTGEKPYQCQICLRRFSVKTNLDAHLRIHNNEKPFQCKICKKSFGRKAYLTQHTRIHTGEKPFQCQFCGKRCTQIGDLKKHIRIHTGEKPYQCKICNKKFRYSSHLKSHSRRLHPIKMQITN